MAKSRKAKPSFDLPAGVPATAGVPVETGWVHRSDRPADPAPIARRLPPADSSAPAAARVLRWLTLPFEIALILALVPLGSTPPMRTAAAIEPRRDPPR